jgi:hypothetical protein
MRILISGVVGSIGAGLMQIAIAHADPGNTGPDTPYGTSFANDVNTVCTSLAANPTTQGVINVTLDLGVAANAGKMSTTQAGYDLWYASHQTCPQYGPLVDSVFPPNTPPSESESPCMPRPGYKVTLPSCLDGTY